MQKTLHRRRPGKVISTKGSRFYAHTQSVVLYNPSLVGGFTLRHALTPHLTLSSKLR